MLRKLWPPAALFVLFFSSSFAQSNISLQDREFLLEKRDSLARLTDLIMKVKNDTERISLNATCVKTLLEALKRPYSFDFELDSLMYISTLRADNNSFRIITWYLPVNNGYKFYGAVQMNTANGQLKLFPLTDSTATFGNVNQIVSNKKWYGARYYQMIPVKAKDKPDYYILLGWKGNNNKTTKKVIDVLSFENGEPVFGKKIFETENRESIKNRVVFEYNIQNTMTLYHDKKSNIICFDHLVLFDSEMSDDFEFYGSDSSFDGYLINYNKLIYKQDVELNNDPNEQDNKYITPVKASTMLKNRKK